MIKLGCFTFAGDSLCDILEEFNFILCRLPFSSSIILSGTEVYNLLCNRCMQMWQGLFLRFSVYLGCNSLCFEYNYLYKKVYLCNFEAAYKQLFLSACLEACIRKKEKNNLHAWKQDKSSHGRAKLLLCMVRLCIYIYLFCCVCAHVPTHAL